MLSATSIFLLACLCVYVYWKGSLDGGGAVAAFSIGLGILSSGSHVQWVVLLLFFFTSSRLTKVGKVQKEKLEEDTGEGGRTAVQVLCNGLTGAVCAYAYGRWIREQHADPRVWFVLPLTVDTAVESAWWGFLGHFICCCADTWASEIGILSRTPPRMVTTLATAAPGTNGAMSVVGTSASMAAGLFIGLAVAIIAPWEGSATIYFLPFLTFTSILGFYGSIVDSILGATLQATYQKGGKILKHYTKGSKRIAGRDVLSNNQVNFLASLITAATAAYIGPKLKIAY